MYHDIASAFRAVQPGFRSLAVTIAHQIFENKVMTGSQRLALIKIKIIVFNDEEFEFDVRFKIKMADLFSALQK